MYDFFCMLTSGALVVSAVAMTACLCGAAAMAMSYDKVTLTFDIARITKRFFMVLLFAAATSLATISLSLWFGFRDHAFAQHEGATITSRAEP